MEWLFWVGAWYASGMAGSWLVLEFSFREDFDITVGDVFVGILMAIFGPINLLAGLVGYLASCGAFSRVIFKKRGRRA